MKTQKQYQHELTELENQYRRLVKLNPVSINDTKAHLQNISYIVARMKTLRNGNAIASPVDNGSEWLKKLIYNS